MATQTAAGATTGGLPPGCEAHLAARWSAGEWRGQSLLSEGGNRFTLVYEGRRGGGAGPDFRDAVLERADGSRLRGDIELHLRASDWQAHGHGRDPRYNAVVLHVVLAATTAETALASGETVPVVVLRPASDGGLSHPAHAWPCASLLSHLGPPGVRGLLLAAGRERFEQRASSFAQVLATESVRYERGLWTPADRVLFVAVAEALGYGRDRGLLRDAGMHLARGGAPDPLFAEAIRLPRVERMRLDGLLALFDRWERGGPWDVLRGALNDGPPRAAARNLIAHLSVSGGSVSPGRAGIVVTNVALPFAAAYADHTDDTALGDRARRIYLAMPGLPSNQITREMRRQLCLPRSPAGASAQQGLHHIWASWCRDKRCAECPCNPESR
jgi:hypothetical protein